MEVRSRMAGDSLLSGGVPDPVLEESLESGRISESTSLPGAFRDCSWAELAGVRAKTLASQRR